VNRPTIISGFQTGTDRAAIRAARTLGLETGGWLPKGWLAEDGQHPEFAEFFGARECPEGDNDASRYRARTRANVRDSDVTVWIGGTDSGGYRATLKAVMDLQRPMFQVDPGPEPGWRGDSVTVREKIDDIARAAGANSWRRINVAGHRRSTHPWLGPWAEAFCVDLFRAILGRSGGA
jgi:hypothetical protein